MKRSISEYINKYRNLNKNGSKKIRIAFLSSFTSRTFKEVLTVQCSDEGINCEFYEGAYNQYAQEIINTNGKLYKFKPELIILFIDIKNVFGKNYLGFYNVSESERYDFISEKLNELENLIHILKSNAKAKILVHNFEIPLYSPMGILENKQNNGIVESTYRLNEKLENKYKEDRQVFIFNYEGFCARYGKSNIHDEKMYYIGDLRLKLDYVPNLCREYMGYVKPMCSILKKCLVLDLDNTLWGGIVGEVGIEGIKLGTTNEGKPFWQLQQYLLTLNKRGILLAINSKNNKDEAMKVIREHPYMVLREDNFACMEINWNDKVSNLKTISEKLNIGLDSIVFMDDDKLNREMVKGELPEVKVIELPEDPALYLNTVMKLDDFNILEITDEDKNKHKIYSEQKKRDAEKENSVNIEEYIKNLNMKIEINENDRFNIARISQLTQKTNQFNMTGKRYSDETIEYLMDNSEYKIISARVFDKFGDNGLTAVMIINIEKNRLNIQGFFMSCRIIGRRVEYNLIDYIVKKAKNLNIKEIVGDFIKNDRNIPSSDIYKDYGFEFLEEKDKIQHWIYKL
ncbi:MAG: HAD-IIIC family phosphatase [Clostridium sp.]|nr:HAD-IIIC family phosphatase [Clostridium sp.]